MNSKSNIALEAFLDAMVDQLPEHERQAAKEHLRNTMPPGAEKFFREPISKEFTREVLDATDAHLDDLLSQSLTEDPDHE